MKLNVKILGTGSYLPENKVSSDDLDVRFRRKIGTSEKKTNIHYRYYVGDDDSTSKMGALAARQALERAGLNPLEIDCIITTSSVPEQPIPSTASLVQKHLDLQDSGIPCFDINSTCLSHMTALEQVAAPQISLGRYKNVLIVSSETPSLGLNHRQLESSILMGDCAAATVLSQSEGESFFSQGEMATYSLGAHLAEIRGGGSRIHPKFMKDSEDPNFQFDMNGREIFKLSSKKMPEFLNNYFEKIGKSMEDFDLVIPHQASYQALKLMGRRLVIPQDKIYNIVQNYGNQVSASIPFALNHAIENGRIERGNEVLLIGTAAGLSLGALHFKY